MLTSLSNSPPKNESELIERCQAIAGLSFAQLADRLHLPMPSLAPSRKGWAGMAIEQALGGSAGHQALPDFPHLGIELKTLPINSQGKVRESTFITTIPLLTIHQQSWESSQCYHKLQRVLWLPVEGDPSMPYGHRRIGMGFLWSPDEHQTSVLASDWQYLCNRIAMGQLEDMDARHGEYLQVRPKGANAKSLVWAFNPEGEKMKTLPRGFYLRTKLTTAIYQSAL